MARLIGVSRGSIQRLAVFMPPGSAKSTYGSILFPAWYLAKHPTHSILAASHTTELAEKWGRRVRNLIEEHGPTLGLAISQDNAAAGRWALTSGGEYYAAGVGVGIAGFRADLAIIDDPVRSREDADSALVREKTWEWYKSDLSTRMKPGGRIVLIQCMTGDTPVLMETGQEKLLRDIRAGDRVATYENGKVSISVVRNWINHGPDRVLEIRMKSGIIVKANARHPFLVEEDGETKWQRTDLLKKGNVILRVIGASGRVSRAPQKGVISRPNAKACAIHTTAKIDGKLVFDRPRLILSLGAIGICATATELAFQIMNAFWPNRAEFVPYVGSHLQTTIRAPIGTISFASITATIVKRLEGFSATTATLLSGMGRLRKSFSQPLSMCEVARDTIVEIVDAGIEEVFDVQIDRTENFIANGLVSKNTRWSEDDLAGRLLLDMRKGGDQWEVLSLPALAEAGDPLGRDTGEVLWDDAYGYGNFLRHERATQSARNWSALYQQNPVPEEGNQFKADWLRPYTTHPALETLSVYGGSDYAVTSDGGDYTCHVVVGLDVDGRCYLLDLWRGQSSPDVWVREWCRLVREWRPLDWAEESGQITSALGPYIEEQARARKAYVNRERFATKGDKAVRCQSIRGRMANDGLYVPMQAPWYSDFRAELLSFPAGKHDDQVDSLGLVGQLIDRMIPGREPGKPEKAKIKTGYKSDELEREDWRTY
jgi:predicted phage terminase large subunit-like protein